MPANDSAEVFIYDAENSIKNENVITILWRSFNHDALLDQVYSLPDFIEENSELVRNRYLAWLFEFSEIYLDGERLINHLELREGFSYWWMTLLSEKSNFSKSKNINDAIRLIAFDEWSKNRKITSIVLFTPNKPLVECFRHWCEKHDVNFKLGTTEFLIKIPLKIQKIIQSAKYFLLSFIWLFNYLISRRKLIGIGLSEWTNSVSTTTFVSYLDNCVSVDTSSSQYESNYWGTLPDLLIKNKYKTNWLHLYVKDRLLPTAKEAAIRINSFNKNGGGYQNHVTLDSFININTLFSTLKDWIRLFKIGFILENKIRSHHSSKLKLWPLFVNDWRQSLIGVTLMSNLLSINLFERAFKLLPKQKKGFYLQENQGWEFGFISTWRRSGNETLIGVPHTTVKFWDLRYFFDHRSYHQIDEFAMPMPNIVACNGKAMLEIYEKGRYPQKDLVEVEALRYLNLRVKSAGLKHKMGSKGLARILVIGDYVEKNTQKQLSLLNDIASNLPNKSIITFKPHPNSSIKIHKYKNIKILVSYESIEKLLLECNIVYTSVSSSAGIEAYCLGLPILSQIDPEILNISPLRGCDGVVFVRSAEELLLGIRAGVSVNARPIDPHKFLNIDNELTSWKKLLLI